MTKVSISLGINAQGNISPIECEHPDPTTYPLVAHAAYTEAILGPGMCACVHVEIDRECVSRNRSSILILPSSLVAHAAYTYVCVCMCVRVGMCVCVYLEIRYLFVDEATCNEAINSCVLGPSMCVRVSKNRSPSLSLPHTHKHTQGTCCSYQRNIGITYVRSRPPSLSTFGSKSKKRLASTPL